MNEMLRISDNFLFQMNLLTFQNPSNFISILFTLKKKNQNFEKLTKPFEFLIFLFQMNSLAVRMHMNFFMFLNFLISKNERNVPNF